jgi:single-stranded-DNA-specific exonuclease
MTAKRWIVRGQDTNRVVSLARLLGTSQVLAALLISRGCADKASARAFLQPSYDQLHEPYLMLGMKEAISRLRRAVAIHSD